jgi:hypothetical protein
VLPQQQMLMPGIGLLIPDGAALLLDSEVVVAMGLETVLVLHVVG